MREFYKKTVCILFALICVVGCSQKLDPFYTSPDTYHKRTIETFGKVLAKIENDDRKGAYDIFKKEEQGGLGTFCHYRFIYKGEPHCWLSKNDYDMERYKKYKRTIEILIAINKCSASQNSTTCFEKSFIPERGTDSAQYELTQVCGSNYLFEALVNQWNPFLEFKGNACG